MQFEELEKKILSNLLKNKKKCINKIEDNRKVVQEYLNDEKKQNYIKGFVNKLNDIIVEDLKKFTLVEEVLRHELLINVLAEFKRSDVLIRAFKKSKPDTIKWLMTMDIDFLVQDEQGRTALMYAANNEDYSNIVEEIIGKNEDCLYIVDNQGRTALFYATNSKTLEILLKTSINVNHIDNNGDTILTKCCKQKNYKILKQIFDVIENINQVNNEGKNAAMYLVQEGRYEELHILSRKSIDYNYRNKNNDTLVTVLMNKFKEIYSTGKFFPLKDYIYTLYLLIYYGCNFNVAIDKEGNTPIMFFLMVGDYFSTTLLLEKCKKLDLSIKNDSGIGVSYLLFTIHFYNEQVLRQFIINHKTFDCDYTDSNNNSLLMHLIVRGYYDEIIKQILERKKIPNQVNNKGENALIIATKIGSLPIRESLFKDNDVNQQDYLGNTALFYALKLRDKEAINMLCYHKANPYLKNEHGISAIDLTNEIDDPVIVEIMKNPLPPKEMAKRLEDERKTSSTDKKVNNYVKNYQMDIYKKEYEYMTAKKDYTYSPIVYPLGDKEMGLQIFLNSYQFLYKTQSPSKMKNFRNRNNEYYDYDENNFLINIVNEKFLTDDVNLTKYFGTGIVKPNFLS
eukprot:jgi/Orpsp1_1/1174718/evm.model.c7180000051124.1